jgi:SAM-dependent methyltransferase
MDGFALSVCSRCGAGYADGIPPQSVFDRYYGEMSKYERSQAGGELSDVDADRYRQTADLIAPQLRSGDAIVDVGCATGALLAELKRRGFSNVLGIDPSPACADIGRRLYGIPIRNMPGSRLSEVPERFDLAILTGVLEHLRDVDGSLDRVLGLLKPGGKIYIEIPDATRYSEWFSAPYQFFSMEHVNYFSPRSLTNLMLRLGLRAEFVERVPRWLGPAAGEPAIAGLFRCDPGIRESRLDFDTETEPALKSYIRISQELEARVHRIIDNLARARTPLVVWGAGTHTLRLMETSALPEANLLAFIDSNSRYHGRMLRGIPIVAPAEWSDSSATILISSHVAEREIRDQIIDTLKWPNPIICLYDGVSPHAKKPESN